MSALRNRIVGLRYVSGEDLLANPRNYRNHPKAQSDALAGLLAEVGIANALLADVQTDSEAVQALLGDLAAEAGIASALSESDDQPYTRKIEAPIYEPKGEQPPLSALYDDQKTAALVQAIDAADIPADVQAFLRIAAQRHTVLHFARIADYYAHADAAIQRLMEDSALVIIDFKRAIELGFVQMTQEIADQVRDEYGD